MRQQRIHPWSSVALRDSENFHFHENDGNTIIAILDLGHTALSVLSMRVQVRKKGEVPQAGISQLLTWGLNWWVGNPGIRGQLVMRVEYRAEELCRRQWRGDLQLQWMPFPWNALMQRRGLHGQPVLCPLATTDQWRGGHLTAAEPGSGHHLRLLQTRGVGAESHQHQGSTEQVYVLYHVTSWEKAPFWPQDYSFSLFIDTESFSNIFPIRLYLFEGKWEEQSCFQLPYKKNPKWKTNKQTNPLN